MGSTQSAASVGIGPGEAMFVTGLALIVTAGGAIGGGAALAAMLVGQPPPGGLVDAVRVIPGLVSQPDDPASAWSSVADSAVQLPGPVLYWASTAGVLVGLIVLIALVRMLWRAMSPGRQRLGVDTDARFATRRELRPLLIRRPVPGRLVLGTWRRWLVATESQRWDPTPTRGWAGFRAWLTGRRRRGRFGDVTSVAVVGPTRCGKTAECAIPAVLDWTGPAILLSVKRDLMDTTIAQRRRLGQVRVFDPGGATLRNDHAAVHVRPDEVARWSPLRSAHTPTGAKKAGAALAAWTPKGGVEGGMSFWENQGKLLFAGLLGAAALSQERSMREVAEWVFSKTRPGSEGGCRPMTILDTALRDDDPTVRAAAENAVLHLAAIWNTEAPQVLSSIYSTAVTVCDPWLDPQVVGATDFGTDELGEWVDLDWLMNTGPDGNQANTLYLVVSTDDYERLAPVLAGLLSDLKAQVYEWEAIGRKLPAPLLMLIDEAGNMPLSWLPEVSSTCAGLGLQLMTVWQSLAQIHDAYGGKADILLTNHATKLFFPGASDDSTLGYQTKIAGDEGVERRSWSADLGAGRRSISGQDNREALVPYFLARLPMMGQALMIHSNTPPAQVVGRRWWLNRRLVRLTQPVEHVSDTARSSHGPWESTPAPQRERRRAGPPRGVHADTRDVTPPSAQRSVVDAR